MATLTPNSDAEVKVQEKGTLIKIRHETATSTNASWGLTVPVGKVYKVKKLGFALSSGNNTSGYVRIDDGTGAPMQSNFSASVPAEIMESFDNIEFPAGWTISFNTVTAGSVSHFHTVIFRDIDA